MISKSKETIVGLFVLAALAILLVMVVILARHEGLWAKYVNYKTQFEDIKGLQPDNNVRLSGVTIGTVTDTEIQEDGRVLVKFKVEAKQRDKIHEGAVATVGSVGLLGDKSLDLTFGDPSKPPFPVGGMMESREAIGFQDIMNKATGTLDEVKKTFANLVDVTDTIKSGKGTIGKLVENPALYNRTLDTVNNARTFTQALKQGTGALGLITRDQKFKGELQRTMHNIGEAAKNVRQGSTPLGEALQKVPDIINKVDSFTTNLQKAGVGLPGLVDQGQNALSDANEVISGVKKAPIVRRLISKPQERTIQVDESIQ